jgi:hypothetical protein
MGRMLEDPKPYGVDAWADLRAKFRRWEQDDDFFRVKRRKDTK